MMARNIYAFGCMIAAGIVGALSPGWVGLLGSVLVGSAYVLGILYATAEG